MKYIRMGMTCIMLILATVLISCSPDAVEEYEEEVEEVQIIEEPPTPEPDWADGTMTITVGRFATKEQLVAKLKEDFSLGPGIEGDIMDENFSITPPKKQYTINIAVVAMQEVGITEPTTMPEAREMYRNEGYLPLTPEEVMELRLHLKDQPDSSTGHRWWHFFTLPTEETTLIHRGTPYVFILRHVKFTKGRGTKKSIVKSACSRDGSRLFYPNDQDPWLIRWYQQSQGDKNIVMVETLPTRFACAIRGSKRSK